MRWAVVALAAAAPAESGADPAVPQSQPSAGCASPFHTPASVLFPPVPTVLPSEGYCKQFYGQRACCLPAYTLAVAAQVEGAVQRTAAWPRARRVCVDRMLEFYVGAACSLCDPGWARYSSEQDGKWVVAVREENCHYLWAACGPALEDQYTAPQFCNALMNLHEGAVEQILMHTAPTEAPVAPKAVPVVATVRHAKTRLRHASRVAREIALVARRLRVVEPTETGKAAAFPSATAGNATEATAAAASKAAENATATTENAEDTLMAASSDEEDSDDEAAGEDAEEDGPTLEPGVAVVHSKAPGESEDTTTVVNVSAPVISASATERTAQQAGAPCKLPFPALVFSPLPQALSAVDEGQFGGFERGAAAALALWALLPA